MTRWKNKAVVLEIEPSLARDIGKIANRQRPKMTWNDQARSILYRYVELHKANVKLIQSAPQTEGC